MFLREIGNMIRSKKDRSEECIGVNNQFTIIRYHLNENSVPIIHG